jgi:GGDEF domain-containing protein
MRFAPIPDNESIRLAAVRAAVCSYAPREERFDRITRTAKRLFETPIALITIVEEDEQWFRSVQGLDVPHTPRDISFCGHVAASCLPLVIQDVLTDPDFADNPLVTGPPRIRSYMGWPLEIAPGLVAGSLCVIDTVPRIFDNDDMFAMRDLARMAEAELRVVALSSVQKSLLMRLDLAQRRQSLDAATGCWSLRGFRELLGLAVQQAREDLSQLGLCHLRLVGMDDALVDLGDPSKRPALLSRVVQQLRDRLPLAGALARLGENDFCALVPTPTVQGLDHALNGLSGPGILVELVDGRALKVRVKAEVIRLTELGDTATASSLWATLLGRIGGATN